MFNRLRILVTRIAQAFWFIPTLMVLVGILGAVGLMNLDRSGQVPDLLIQSAWLYNGGGTGARTLLGTVAASSIGVAGTVFSIAIAALSPAAGCWGHACCATLPKTVATSSPSVPSSAPSLMR